MPVKIEATFLSTTSDQLISVRRSSATSLRNSISEPALPVASPPSRRTRTNTGATNRIEGTPLPRVAPQSPDRVETMQRTMREQNLAGSPLPARLRGTDRLHTRSYERRGYPGDALPAAGEEDGFWTFWEARRRAAAGRRKHSAPPLAPEDAEVSAALAKAPPLDAAVTPPATTRTRRRPAAATPGSRRAPTPEELDRVRLMARLEDSLSPPPAERVAAGGRASPPGPALARRASSGVGRSIEAHGSMHGLGHVNGRPPRTPGGSPYARQESGGSPTPFARFDGRYALNSLVAAGARGCLKPDAASPMAMGEEGWAAASFASVGRRDPAAPLSPTRRAFRGATAAAARERASWGQLLAAA